MVFIGHVRNGVIVADNLADLPEGATVRVEWIAESESKSALPVPLRQGGQYAGQIWMSPDFDEWPADLQESLGMTL